MCFVIVYFVVFILSVVLQQHNHLSSLTFLFLIHTKQFPVLFFIDHRYMSLFPYPTNTSPRPTGDSPRTTCIDHRHTVTHPRGIFIDHRCGGHYLVTDDRVLTCAELFLQPLVGFYTRLQTSMTLQHWYYYRHALLYVFFYSYTKHGLQIRAIWFIKSNSKLF